MSSRGCKIYIGKLPKDCRESEIEKKFGTYGRIRDVLLKYGYGFIEYDDARDAEDAVYEMDGRSFLGERIIVELARGTRRERSADRRHGRRAPWLDKYGAPERTKYRVTVENLSTRVSWQDLKDLMRRTAEVCYADAHKEKRNVGIIEFGSRRDLEKALEKYDGYEMNGRKIKLIDETRRSRSRSRRRSRSRSRKRSRSRSRKRSRSRSRRRSRSRSGRRSRSRSRKSKRSRSKSSRDAKKAKRSASRSKSKSNKDAKDSASKARSKSGSRSRQNSADAKKEDRNNSEHRNGSRSRSKDSNREEERSKSRSRSKSRDEAHMNGDSKPRSRSRSEASNSGRE